MADVVFATSGSTGDAKRVVRSEESLMEDAAALVSAFSDVWRSRPAVVSSVRPEHMYGALWRVRAPAVAGSRVDPAVVVSVEELSAVCPRYGRVLFVTTPSFLEKALLHPDFAALKGSFEAIVTSGSLLRRETSLAVASAVAVCPTEIFGSTETGTVAFRRRTEGENWRVIDDVGFSRSDDGRLVVDSPFAMVRPYVMGDIVEIVSSREFVLLGRADRRVKILERYVSLTETEKAIAAHPLVSRVRVETTADAVPRLGALIVPSEEGAAALSCGTYASVAARLRRDLLSVSGALAFPRRIRFVRALPFNEQGKTTAAAARAALSSWCQEPVVLSWQATDSALSARLVFPPDAECFRGHFPGFPVLPGVAQLFFLGRFSRQAFADFPETVTFRRLKFQKIILPSRETVLSVTRRDDRSFAFSMTSAGGNCSSGIVERTHGI